MAITINQTPVLYTPTYNEMVYILSSTQTAQPRFKYLADVYINGSVTRAVRLRVAIEPNNAKGIIKLQGEIETFLTQDVGNPEGQVATTPNNNSILDYLVEFGEEYEVAGVLTQFPNDEADTSRYAFNGCLEYYNFIDWNYIDYLLGSNIAQYMTNAPTTIDTMLTNSGWLYFIANPTAPVDVFRITTKDANGVIIGVWEVNNTLTFATTGENFGKVASHPHNINALPNTEFNLGIQPVFTGVEASYDIQAIELPTKLMSEVRTFNIISPCKFERWNMIFLSRLGGFDSFTFSLLSRDEDKITKEFYKKEPTRLVSSGFATGSYTWSRADREKVTFFTKSSRTRELNSNWVDEETYTWLSELVSSPVAYLEDGSNNLIAVTILDTSFTFKKRVNDKLFNLKITVELADNYGQRG